MPALLLKFLRPLAPYLAAAIVVLAASLYIVVLRHDLQNANGKNAALAEQNAANVAAIASYKMQEQKWDAALRTLDAQSLSMSNASGQITAKINLAPPRDDAPVAPVLSQALDSLRALQGVAP